MGLMFQSHRRKSSKQLQERTKKYELQLLKVSVCTLPGHIITSISVNHKQNDFPKKKNKIMHKRQEESFKCQT